MIPHDAKISISNIAWPGNADDEALKLVHELGFCGIELAPGKVFSHRDAVDEARKYRKLVEDRRVLDGRFGVRGTRRGRRRLATVAGPPS